MVVQLVRTSRSTAGRSRVVVMYIVYIIQSQKDNSYYIGHTNDLDDRMARHNQGKSQYTKSRVPWYLVYAERHETRGEAMKREYEIKKKKSKNYIKWLINNRK